MMRCFALAAALLAACASDGKQHRGDSGVATLPARASCTTDSDCRLASDYCGGCACRSLATAEPDPTCKGTVVQCFVDPCRGRLAVCQSGTCAAAGP